MFGGGGPSTVDVIKEEFAKQKEYLEKAFAETQEFIEEQITDQSLSLHIIEGKADMDVLGLKHDFIMHLKHATPEILDQVAATIASEMTYFEHRRTTANLRQSFEKYCDDK